MCVRGGSRGGERGRGGREIDKTETEAVSQTVRENVQEGEDKVRQIAPRGGSFRLGKYLAIKPSSAEVPLDRKSMQADFVHAIHCHTGLHVAHTWPKEFENNMVTTCIIGESGG